MRRDVDRLRSREAVWAVMRVESLERARSKEAGEVVSRCKNLVLEIGREACQYLGAAAYSEWPKRRHALLVQTVSCRGDQCTAREVVGN